MHFSDYIKSTLLAIIDEIAADPRKFVVNPGKDFTRNRKMGFRDTLLFYSSMVDARMLKSGQDFKKLKDSYVIFIYKHDKFKEGKPLYHIDRYVRETGKLFEDGSHIIYVNGSYKGDDEIARLMADFHQKESEGIHFKALADGVKHFKETEEGREIMCESVEKYAQDYAEKYAEKYGKECADKSMLEGVKNLMKSAHVSLEQAIEMLGLKGTTRDYILSQLQK